MAIPNLVSERIPTRPSVVQRPRQFPEIDPRDQRYCIERMAMLLQQKEILLQEVYHRVGNSLQIIASILALDARKVHSEEARLHLENAQRRILAVGTMQKQLQTSRGDGDLELAVYLRQLCENLTASVVGDATRIAINVRADAGTVSSAVAMNMGLCVTELVFNALKHAFMADAASGRIIVNYHVEGHGWKLTVSDNGGGMPKGDQSSTATGLGTGLVASLVRQLGGWIETSTNSNGLGTSVSITSRSACPTHDLHAAAGQGTGRVRLRGTDINETLTDVIRRYMQARAKNGIVSTLDAANTISKVVPVNYLSAEEFDELIALVAIDYGLAVEFDRRSGSAEPSAS